MRLGHGGVRENDDGGRDNAGSSAVAKEAAAFTLPLSLIRSSDGRPGAKKRRERSMIPRARKQL
jgi:hypothetical protein